MNIFFVILELVILAWLARSLYLVRRAMIANRAARAMLTPYNRTLKKPRYHLLVLGDSTMFGSGVTKRTDTMGGQLATLFSNATVETLATSGTKVAELPQQLQSAQHQRYNLVVVGVGGNDIVFLTNYSTLERELRSFLSSLESRASTIILMHCVNLGNTGFFLWPLSYFFDYRTRKLSQLYSKIAQDFAHVQYINFYRPRRYDHYTSKTRPRFIADDKFHPNDYASRYFFEEMRQEIGLDETFLQRHP